jgi:hypothetical protein
MKRGLAKLRLPCVPLAGTQGNVSVYLYLFLLTEP